MMIIESQAAHVTDLPLDNWLLYDMSVNSQFAPIKHIQSFSLHLTRAANQDVKSLENA